MNDFKINNVVDLSAEERYSYFIQKVADFEMVWGLYSDGWALAGDDNGNEVFPFWPEQDFATICAVGLWEGYIAKAIPLNDFIEKWLSGMERDKKHAGIFYIPKGKGIVVDPVRLRSDIESEIKQYE